MLLISSQPVFALSPFMMQAQQRSNKYHFYRHCLNPTIYHTWGKHAAPMQLKTRITRYQTVWYKERKKTTWQKQRNFSIQHLSWYYVIQHQVVTCNYFSRIKRLLSGSYFNEEEMKRINRHMEEAISFSSVSNCQVYICMYICICILLKYISLSIHSAVVITIHIHY